MLSPFFQFYLSHAFFNDSSSDNWIFGCPPLPSSLSFHLSSPIRLRFSPSPDLKAMFLQSLALLTCSTWFNLRATKGGGTHPLRFFRCHTFCFWNRILTFSVAVGGPFAHI